MLPVGDAPMLCFTPETRIATPRGEVRMRDLRVGHLVLCQGIGGAVQPIKWIGKVQAEIARHPRPERVRPILIKAGALEDGVPSRDLRVSPDHAILRGIVLVPARLLLNGVTILQEQDWPQITYYHLELPRHSVVIADGAPAESWLDDGRRSQFSNSGVTVRFVDFEGACASRGLTCFPVLRDERSTAPLRASLAARARDLGFQEVDEPDMRLRVGESVFKSQLAGPGRYVFRLNAEAATTAQRLGLSLTSRVSTETAAVGRQLGAAISGLMLRAGHASVSIGAGDPRLRSIRGLGAPEAPPPGVRGGLRRWIEGIVRLPPTLLAGLPRLFSAQGNVPVLEIEVFLAEQDPFWLPAEAGPPAAPKKRRTRNTKLAAAAAPMAPPIMLRAGALDPDDNPFNVVTLPSATGIALAEREDAERAG
ncbi:Hint domain-containing protein [Plastoroseomonas arctica]|uniref:Hint domain-containing protein n=1 Tax=Plastoroseomonas arctica TaxID=1509237 RepID=A0AAF1K3Q1_9PROT|nr:Hint domain-containing protein [Plastoroseomonas arctica]MBR0655701.1 Hint domain-containing protein [Plastoroseomonas arctica]